MCATLVWLRTALADKNLVSLLLSRVVVMFDGTTMMVRTLIAIILYDVTFMRSERGYRIPSLPPYDLYGIDYLVDDDGFFVRRALPTQFSFCAPKFSIRTESKSKSSQNKPSLLGSRHMLCAY